MASTAMRKVRDEVDARACLAAAVRTRRTLKEWANENGVDGRSLRMWQLSLERRQGADEAPPVRLVELVPTAPVRARYVVRLGDIEVEVDDGFRDDTLRRLLAVIG